MECIISCIKNTPTGKSYSAICIDGSSISLIECKSYSELSVGECATLGEDGYLLASDVDNCNATKSRITEGVNNRIRLSIRKEAHQSRFTELNKTTSLMWDKLSKAASLFLRKVLYGAPIIIRFHNDIDGACTAYAVYKGVVDFCNSDFRSEKQNMVWIMHRGVSYSQADASSDLLIANNYSSVEKPLLLIMDFGTSDESNKGIPLVKDEFDIIWLDHHPIEDGFIGEELEHYINPWQFGMDSNYPAGFLACSFVRSFSSIETGYIERASLYGDYSKYYLPDGEKNDFAEILDLITSDTKLASSQQLGNLTPMEIDAILMNKEKREELANYAATRLSEVLYSAMRSIKKYSAGTSSIYVLDFEKVRDEESRYPLPGRFSSKLLDKIGESVTDAILIVHFGKYISIRVRDEAGDRLRILDIIKNAKERELGVEAGGGHKNAASIKVVDEAVKKDVLKFLIDSIKLKESSFLSE